MLLDQIKSYSLMSERAPHIEKELSIDIGQVPTGLEWMFSMCPHCLILNPFIFTCIKC